MQERAALPNRLELGDVRLQENAIDRTAGQRDVITQQRGCKEQDRNVTRCGTRLESF